MGSFRLDPYSDRELRFTFAICEALGIRLAAEVRIDLVIPGNGMISTAEVLVAVLEYSLVYRRGFNVMEGVGGGVEEIAGRG